MSTLEQWHEDDGFALRNEPVADLTLGTVLSSRANARGHSRSQSREVKLARENGWWLARALRARELIRSSDFVLMR